MVRRVVVSAVRVVAVAAAVEEAGDGLAVAARVRAALVREAPEPLVDERRALREAPGALEAREVGGLHGGDVGRRDERARDARAQGDGERDADGPRGGEERDGRERVRGRARGVPEPRRGVVVVAERGPGAARAEDAVDGDGRRAEGLVVDGDVRDAEVRRRVREAREPRGAALAARERRREGRRVAPPAAQEPPRGGRGRERDRGLREAPERRRPVPNSNLQLDF